MTLWISPWISVFVPWFLNFSSFHFPLHFLQLSIIALSLFFSTLSLQFFFELVRFVAKLSLLKVCLFFSFFSFFLFFPFFFFFFFFCFFFFPFLFGVDIDYDKFLIFSFSPHFLCLFLVFGVFRILPFPSVFCLSWSVVLRLG